MVNVGQLVPRASKRRVLSGWAPLAALWCLHVACGGMSDELTNEGAPGGSSGARASEPSRGSSSSDDAGAGVDGTTHQGGQAQRAEGGSSAQGPLPEGGAPQNGEGGNSAQGPTDEPGCSSYGGQTEDHASLVPNQIAAQDLVVDDDGFSYVVGTSTEAPGSFLLKLDGTGALLWSRNLGTETATADPTLRLTSDGHVLIGVIEGYAQGGRQISLFRYDADGTWVSEYFVPEPLPQGAAHPHLEIFEAGAGDIYLWGSFAGSWPVGPTMLDANSSLDVFRLRLSPAGDVVEAKQFSSAEYNRINHAVVDDTGVTYVAVSGQEASGIDSDPFVVALDDDLSPLWEARFDPYRVPRGLALFEGELLVVGSQQNMLFLANLDPETSDITSSSAFFASFKEPWPFAALADGRFVVGSDLTVAALSSSGGYSLVAEYCSSGAGHVQALSYGGGSLRAVVAFDYDLDLGSEELDEGPSALLTLTPNPTNSPPDAEDP